jgi:zinc D-Ala-D-Ala carboxypeptidase
MQLSPNFTLAEMTISQNAARAGLTNIPSGAELANLTYTASKLEEIRSLLGTPILVSSGYRSPKVNALAGSSSTSQHVQGKATDFSSPRFGTPKDIVAKIRSSNIEFDQLILEYDNWVHISFVKSDSRKQVLVIDQYGTRNYK